MRTIVCRSATVVALGWASLVLASWCSGSEPARVAATPAAKLDRAAVLRELQDYTPAGMDRKLGPAYVSYHGQGPQENFPQIWMPPAKEEVRGRRYQIGGPWSKEAGDFSSTQGQILYVPDPGFVGVDRVTILEWSNGCFTESPEPPWWGGFRPEPVSAKWQEAARGQLGVPLAAARGMGSWANSGVLVFSSGLIGVAGTCTARGSLPTLQLPAHKIPTGVSVTNKNEFALLTVHDTQRHVGQVAVLSLAVNGKTANFVHEWQDDHAWSLPNVALFSELKLLGYVDLPGLEFPTSISAVGNQVGGRMNGRDGNAGVLKEYDLAHQADRDVFLKGSNAQYGSTAGLAVVIGKYEHKAAFLDLQPLFQRVREMYFTTEANYRKTRDAGPAPHQWPYAFDADPSWKPAVVAVREIPEPTAVIASMSGGERARALIASRDGTVTLFRLGGLATDGPAAAEDIQPVCTVRMGRNPTCLAYQKYSSDTLIAVSRGDREIAWIKYTDREATVIRRLRDARLLDPVFVEQSDTHGIETPLLTVADFKGRKIVNYRFGRVVFATQGGAKFDMGPDGKAEFECGGILEFPGTPLSISATNVN